ncbi:MAG: hypothetical protein PHF92_10550, partial [Bacteroidales bacterium]|nr:hypothetical protein [Bacteroidales bacterium]
EKKLLFLNRNYCSIVPEHTVTLVPKFTVTHFPEITALLVPVYSWASFTDFRFSFTKFANLT